MADAKVSVEPVSQRKRPFYWLNRRQANKISQHLVSEVLLLVSMRLYACMYIWIQKLEYIVGRRKQHFRSLISKELFYDFLVYLELFHNCSKQSEWTNMTVSSYVPNSLNVYYVHTYDCIYSIGTTVDWVCWQIIETHICSSMQS